MSVEAITWALRQPISHSSAKFVLVVLANCASADTGQAFPSTAYLAEATGQDRKTVVANLARLQQWGLIEDTGRRTGTTKQIIIYRLITGPDLFAENEEKRNSSENGSVPKKAGKSPVFPGNSTENGTRNRQNHQETGDIEGARAAASPDAPRGTAAGRACLLMRKAGCTQTNPSHPDLLAALAEGVTPEVLGDCAAEAIEAGIHKPFAWAITTARSRHARGARTVSPGANSRGNDRRLSAAERVRARNEEARQRAGAVGGFAADLVGTDG